MLYSERLLGATALASLTFACLFSLQVERADAQTVVTGTINTPPITINDTNGLRIGQNGSDGTLNVFSGTTVPIGQLIEIGVANANGTLNVHQGASVSHPENFVFIEVGNGFNEGTINLYESGQFFVPTGDILLEGQGTINIGGEENAAARAAGFLEADDILMLNGSKIVINTTSISEDHLVADLTSVTSGAGEVLFENGSTRIKNNNSQFSGKMFFEEGATVEFSGTDAVGNAQLYFVGGKIASTGNTTVNGDIEVTSVGAVHDATFETSNANFVLPGDIIGNGKVRFEGNGTTTLSGNNTWTGGTTVSGGTLDVRNGNALGDTSGVSVSGGHLLITDTETVGDVTLTSGTLEIGTGETFLQMHSR